MADTEKYKKLFLTEAEDKISDLNKALLSLERNPGNNDFAYDAMRASHTLKSSASAMGYKNISHLSHAMEDFFERVRIKKHILNPSAIEVLFKSVDVLSNSIREIKKGEKESGTKELVEYLKKLKKTMESDKKISSSKKISVTAKDKTTNSNGEQDVIDENDSNSSNLEFDASVSDSDIFSEKSMAPIEVIKVNIDVLDRLMSLTEELLVEKMRLGEILNRAEGGDSITNYLSELKGSNESFNRLLSELQYNVTQARTVPLGQIFERFPRMVRDLAHLQKKNVVLEMEGQEIELDRSIIDRLGEPIVHLLRNAVDHGIEKKGTVFLSAKRERDKVVIEVEDDGSSIDWQKVVEAAVRKGVVDERKGNELLSNLESNPKSVPKAIEEFLYNGRVSTSEKITETSGRGIGLSIVKSSIETLGGSVSVESPINEIGTRFTIKLPLTLAIIQALLVRAAGQTYALPFSQVDRSVRVPMKNIKKMFDQEVAVIEDEDVAMVRLDKLFNPQEKRNLFFTNEQMQETKRKLHAELMVITKRDEKQVGIVIDELVSEQDIVIKPMQGILKQSKGFAGITFLGDGKPALILDVATLV